MMINKVGSNPVNFHGQFVQNRLLKETIEYAKGETITHNHINFSDDLAEALEYILEYTPDTDVFELRKSKQNTTNKTFISLYKNNKKVKTNEFNSPFNTCILITDYVSDRNFHFPYKENPIITEIKSLEQKKQDIDKEYAPKFDELRNKYYAECDKLSNEKIKRKNSVNELINKLRKDLTSTSIARLDEISKKVQSK